MAAAVLAGAAVAVVLGVAGSVDGAPRALPSVGQVSVQTLKSWVASGVLALVLVQLTTALWRFGRLPGLGPAPRWVNRVHRVSGVLAVVVSLPVAFYCLYGFGFDMSSTRTFVHSLAGCAFYGAFVTKMVALRVRGLPGWVIPVLGGTLFTVFVLVWASSALWWFDAT